MTRAASSRVFTAVVVGLITSLVGCAHGAFEDNAVHFAHIVRDGARTLRRSSQTELVVVFNQLLDTAVPYTIALPSTPMSTDPPFARVGSYEGVVVTGSNPGSSTFHRRYVVVPRELRIEKPQGGPTVVVLRTNGHLIEVVDLR